MLQAQHSASVYKDTYDEDRHRASRALDATRRQKRAHATNVDVDVATHINIYNDGPDRSLLCVETADRPGLLVDLVKITTDINVAVESGEFDTEGLLAKAKLHVSYRGKAVTKPLQQVNQDMTEHYDCLTKELV
ncbi:hypothetical protein TEA_009534 [Camellia sinensis var. sinensis]|uniref:ACT domain-containing protein ACR n=1 Tax=Camellia sinensis var. sinensis TaxID=542762 RepID=A0A4S4CYR7_CAMSN|nr:hypothetical protein TEA_009534 [Camellia sinensis var. sinensis]